MAEAAEIATINSYEALSAFIPNPNPKSPALVLTQTLVKKQVVETTSQDSATSTLEVSGSSTFDASTGASSTLDAGSSSTFVTSTSASSLQSSFSFSSTSSPLGAASSSSPVSSASSTSASAFPSTSTSPSASSSSLALPLGLGLGLGIPFVLCLLGIIFFLWRRSRTHDNDETGVSRQQGWLPGIVPPEGEMNETDPQREVDGAGAHPPSYSQTWEARTETVRTVRTVHKPEPPAEEQERRVVELERSARYRGEGVDGIMDL